MPTIILLLVQQRVYFWHAVCLAFSTLFIATELGTHYLLLSPSCKPENKFSCVYVGKEELIVMRQMLIVIVRPPFHSRLSQTLLHLCPWSSSSCQNRKTKIIGILISTTWVVFFTAGSCNQFEGFCSYVQIGEA